MIFVTVGTTHFDPLIQEVDRLAGLGRLPGPVECQIGSGAYEPRHCAFFRFRRSIDDLLAGADLTICHGGATVFSLLALAKRFVAVPNTALADDHQTKLLTHLAKYAPLHWAPKLSDLERAVTAALASPPPRLIQPHLADFLAPIVLGGRFEAVASRRRV
ncbi:MAG: hypothetical protein IT515_13840 [Burkholderiales bacterium]|nr:hypothetical protein [Burkholderiales bacterium]